MKNIVRKSLNLLYITLVLFVLLSHNFTVNAKINFDDAKGFITAGSNESALDSESLTAIGQDFSEVGGILTFIGAGVLVGAMGYMGILYMVSTPDKQAKIKTQLIGLAVSAVVIFGAYSIWSIIYNLVSTAIGE